jgi:glycosyltransferase involved in cell wall biosynthesis
VREIDIWCDLFDEVVIAAPCHDAAPDGDGLQFGRVNLSITSIPESGGETISSKLWQFALLPWIVARLSIAMWRADAIHVRCPGNLGLLGVLLGPLFSRRLIAKYAGQWNGFPGESRTVTWQRQLLSSRWWRGIVTVYGEWPDQPAHVIPFFTSVMTPTQIDRAKEIAVMDRPQDPFSIVFVGRLSREKNVDTLIESVAQLKAEGVDTVCTIVGHGTEFDRLNALAEEFQVTDQVDFVGGVEYDEVFDFLSRSHVLVLASETEGWPKVIAEAMACGAVCIGSNRGLIPWMLGEGRGFTVTPRDTAGLTDALLRLAHSPDLRLEVSKKAADFGQKYSLESLRDALAELMSHHWGDKIEPSKLDVKESADNLIQVDRATAL